MRLLTLDDEEAHLKFLLKHSRTPINFLSLRQHFIEYYLNPKVHEGCFLGEGSHEKIILSCWMSSRDGEIFLRTFIGDWDRRTVQSAVQAARTIGESYGCKPIVHVILEKSQESWYHPCGATSVTKTDYAPLEHPSDPRFWWNANNRATYGYPTVFFEMRF